MDNGKVEFVIRSAGAGRTTSVWDVVNDGAIVGTIRWFPWPRQYRFLPTDTVDEACLRQIADFTDARTAEIRRKRGISR
jgi:hypothetical protein